MPHMSENLLDQQVRAFGDDLFAALSQACFRRGNHIVGARRDHRARNASDIACVGGPIRLHHWHGID